MTPVHRCASAAASNIAPLAILVRDQARGPEAESESKYRVRVTVGKGCVGEKDWRRIGFQASRIFVERDIAG